MKKMFVGLLTGLFLIFGILTMSSANTIVVTGSIDDGTEVDYWNFSHSQESTITFDILANESIDDRGVEDFFGNDLGNDLLESIAMYETIFNAYEDGLIIFDADEDGLTVSTGGAPVPEPATMLLFGLGLLGLAGVNRRKK